LISSYPSGDFAFHHSVVQTTTVPVMRLEKGGGRADRPLRGRGQTFDRRLSVLCPMIRA